MDRISASLRTQTERLKRLMSDIESDTISLVAVKHRMAEIEVGLKRLKDSI